MPSLCASKKGLRSPTAARLRPQLGPGSRVGQPAQCGRLESNAPASGDAFDEKSLPAYEKRREEARRSEEKRRSPLMSPRGNPVFLSRHRVITSLEINR